MKLKLKKLLHSEHPQHEFLAFAMIGLGLIFIFNKSYFFWPPFAVGILNDDLVGGIYVVIGVLLLKWALSTSGKIYANRRLLVITAGLLAFESTAEFCHWHVSGESHMFTAGFVEAILLAFVFLIITNSKKHDHY